MRNAKYPVSFLYTPLTNVGHIFKAQEVGADVGVFDLEDSVPQDKKISSRNSLKKYLSNDDFLPLRAVRINSVRCRYGLGDILFFVENAIIPDIVIMTMVDSKDEVLILREVLNENQLETKIYVTIETPKSLSKIREIASACEGLILGSADLSAFLGAPITWENMLYARYIIANTAAEYNISAIDTSSYLLDSEEALKEECHRVKELGFHGKAAVHPKQVEAINRIFYPDELQLNYAAQVIEKFSQHNGNIFNFNGQMIGPPFVAKAKRLLEKYEWRYKETKNAE